MVPLPMTIRNPFLPRVLPFAVFMAFIGLEEGLGFLMKKELLSVSAEFLLYLYPLKAISALCVFLYFRKRYDELDPRDLRSLPKTAVSVATGLAVFLLWIRMDWTLGAVGTPAGYDPSALPEGIVRSLSIGFRLFGAALVVPVIEELFWRSFVIRYVADNDFTRVPIGLFTWPSFLITAVLFGLEHHYLYAGIMAGVAYNLLLYYTKSISQCILSHGVTNLILGIYVLQTGEWRFW